MDMVTLGNIIVAALIAEAVWETSKMTWQKGKISIDRLGALIIGILIALGAGLDICALLGLNFIYPIIGQVLTGVLISRGANFVHDILRSLEILAKINAPIITGKKEV